MRVRNRDARKTVTLHQTHGTFLILRSRHRNHIPIHHLTDRRIRRRKHQLRQLHPAYQRVVGINSEKLSEHLRVQSHLPKHADRVAYRPILAQFRERRRHQTTGIIIIVDKQITDDVQIPHPHQRLCCIVPSDTMQKVSRHLRRGFIQNRRTTILRYRIEYARTAIDI